MRRSSEPGLAECQLLHADGVALFRPIAALDVPPQRFTDLFAPLFQQNPLLKAVRVNVKLMGLRAIFFNITAERDQLDAFNAEFIRTLQKLKVTPEQSMELTFRLLYS